MSQTKLPDPTPEDKNRLRDILGCTCSYNEMYDGKSWNNKTEKYEDCECLTKLPLLSAYTTNKIIEELEALVNKPGGDHDSAYYDALKRIAELRKTL